MLDFLYYFFFMYFCEIYLKSRTKRKKWKAERKLVYCGCRRAVYDLIGKRLGLNVSIHKAG